MDEQDALQAIQDIAEIGAKNAENIIGLQESLDSIDSHVIDINDYIVTKSSENKEDEQSTEEINEEKKEDSISSEEETQPKVSDQQISIEELHAEVAEVNQHLQTIENLGIVSIFAEASIVGVILFYIFWKKVLS